MPYNETRDLRAGEKATWVVPTARTRTGLESTSGGVPRRVSFSYQEIKIQKTVDGRTIQLLHYQPILKQ